MKRCLVLAVVALMVMASAKTVFGQDEPTEAAEMKEKWQDMSNEEREKFRAQMRERLDGISEQERGKLRTQMRDRFGSRREEQLKAIKAIEAQLAKLKEGTEGMGRETRPDFREMPLEERTEFRERWTKVREERQKAIGTIIAQIAKLQGQRQPTAEDNRFIIVNTGELEAIRELALKEEAKETARRLERIVKVRSGSGDKPLRPEQRPQKLQRQKMRVKELKAAKKAPVFTLSSFDGRTINLSDYKGKIVVLEWFNIECPFVKYHYDTVHTMVELANKYKDKNVVWLAVNSTSHTTQKANKEFAQKHKLPYPILNDRSGKVGRSYGAETTPHIFIIDTTGNIVYQGAIDNSPMGRTEKGVVNYVDKALEEITSGKSVSVAKSKSYGCSVKYVK